MAQVLVGKTQGNSAERLGMMETKTQKFPPKKVPSNSEAFNPSKIEWDLTNRPRSVSCDRAIRYSGLGVRSVGPVRDFLDLRFPILMRISGYFPKEGLFSWLWRTHKFPMICRRAHC